MCPKYKKIASDIEKDIISGVYNETKKLPTEEFLVKRFNVSRTTIRKAINILVHKGYIYQIQGSGMFLKEAAFKNYINLENTYGDIISDNEESVDRRTIKIEIEQATQNIAQKLQCNQGTALYYVERINYVNNIPMSIQYSYFIKDVIPYLNSDIVEDSIQSYILNDLKQNIGYLDKVIYADKLSFEEAKVLNLKIDDPSLIIESTASLSNGKIFEWSKDVYNYKEARFLKTVNC